MTDDLGQFRAPGYQRPTPTAVKLAGQRLVAYAIEHGVEVDTNVNAIPLDAILGMDVGSDEQLGKDQRLMQFHCSLADG